MTDSTTGPTKDFIVAISVSEPASEELVNLGLSELHVRHGFIEIVRHVLAKGWSVAYGGDLRGDGYTDAVFDLVRTYSRRDVAGPDRVLNYMAWPLWLGVTLAQQADLANIATIKKLERPDGAPETLPPAPERGPADLLWCSLALTQMREQMTSDCGARVVLGGRIAGQQGFYPGVAEEAMLAISARRPLYVAGGFGGCATLIAAALAGTTPAALSLDFQLQHTPRYRELLNAAQAAGHAPSFDNVLGTFRAAGVGGLQNGLGADENSRLFTSDNVDEVVALILLGLRRITQAK